MSDPGVPFGTTHPWPIRSSSRHGETGMSLSCRVCGPWDALLRCRRDLRGGLVDPRGHQGILWFREGHVVVWGLTASGDSQHTALQLRQGKPRAHWHEAGQSSPSRSQPAAGRQQPQEEAGGRCLIWLALRGVKARRGYHEDWRGPDRRGGAALIRK